MGVKGVVESRAEEAKGVMGVKGWGGMAKGWWRSRGGGVKGWVMGDGGGQGDGMVGVGVVGV